MILVIIIGLALLASVGIAQIYEKISGMVVSVHLSPGILSNEPYAIVSFADGRTKIFINGNRAYEEIRINEPNTIYYDERGWIIRVERIRELQ